MADNVAFSIPMDFTGVELWDPTKGGMNDPEPGAYAGMVVAAGEHLGATSGKKSARITVALDGGPETDLYLGLDFSKPSNKQKFATALASCGVTVAKIPPNTNITPAFFMGKDGKGARCYVIVKLVDGVNAKGQKNLNDKEFATKEQYEAYKAIPAASRPVSTPSAPAGGSAPAAPPAGPADLNGLFGG